jgi:hypothetical protein
LVPRYPGFPPARGAAFNFGSVMPPRLRNTLSDGD